VVGESAGGVEDQEARPRWVPSARPRRRRGRRQRFSSRIDASGRHQQFAGAPLQRRRLVVPCSLLLLHDDRRCRFHSLLVVRRRLVPNVQGRHVGHADVRRGPALEEDHPLHAHDNALAALDLELEAQGVAPSSRSPKVRRTPPPRRRLSSPRPWWCSRRRSRSRIVPNLPSLPAMMPSTCLVWPRGAHSRSRISRRAAADDGPRRVNSAVLRELASLLAATVAVFGAPATAVTDTTDDILSSSQQKAQN